MFSENINEKSIPEAEGAAPLPGHGRCPRGAAAQMQPRGRANIYAQNLLCIIKAREATHGEA